MQQFLQELVRLQNYNIVWAHKPTIEINERRTRAHEIVTDKLRIVHAIDREGRIWGQPGNWYGYEGYKSVSEYHAANDSAPEPFRAQAYVLLGKDVHIRIGTPTPRTHLERAQNRFVRKWYALEARLS